MSAAGGAKRNPWKRMAADSLLPSLYRLGRRGKGTVHLHRPGLALIEDAGGGVERDESLPNRPIIDVMISDSKATDGILKQISALGGTVRAIALSSTSFSDAGLKDLKYFPKLETLALANTKVTDAGMKEFLRLEHIENIDLSGNAVTDAALKNLKGLVNLRTLTLDNTPVTDACLKDVAEMKDLKNIFLRETKTTEEGRLALKAALPALHIIPGGGGE
jgi:internalin A